VTLVDALRDALQERHVGVSQQRVHEILASRLDALTPGARIRTTGYFNHSWSPDFVVATGDQAERGVFLRFDVRDEAFADDITYLGDRQPMFLDLHAANPEVDADVVRAAPAAVHAPGDDQRAVLVTDVPAIATFSESVDADRDVGTATAQVVVGGKGVIDDPVASEIVATWHDAVGAAAEADRDQLRTALDKVEEYLSRVASLDLEGALRQRWIAAGQAAEEFPGREDWTLSDRAPWEIARLVIALLKRPGSVATEQWRDIAQAVSASDLGHELYKIGERRHGGEVNRLVVAGLPWWTAQYAYVPPLESDTLERFDWEVGDYSLALNLINRRAYFTDIGRKWSRTPRDQPLPRARERIETLGTGVLGIGLLTSEENIRHELRSTAQRSLAENLAEFIGPLSPVGYRAARITSLDVRVPGSSAVAKIDFNRSVVSTSSPIPLRSFAVLCARFVAGLSEAEIGDLSMRLDGEA
jgi:hypothetical protein